MGHREVFLALARRGNITKEDLAEKLDDSGYGADNENAGTASDNDDSDDASVDSRVSTPRESAYGSDAREDDLNETEEGAQDMPPTQIAKVLLQEPESDFESAGNASSLCSARESYSEGSTPEQSDVIAPDDEFWSNFLPDDGLNITGLTEDEDWESSEYAPDDRNERYGDFANMFSEKSNSMDDRIEIETKRVLENKQKTSDNWDDSESD
ncbi:hypothetical protein CMUS01_12408 [Colletotrichum musicola]|uniref:Uncharacterized protein n=1 Tax=Colletotrichum musicola TaxID=2175873 RepID=A0A8H6JMA9_9PEZI|nr:hypothetical protein CMUS01_12408 [Colletotrichum musicola]